MATTKIIVDEVEYNIRIRYETLRRAFEIYEGPNSGTAINGKMIRDIIGTKYWYQIDIEADPADPESYDSFYQMISSPDESHEVTFPYGQTTITFDAVIQSGEDKFMGMVGGKNRWSGLSITFMALEPQRG